MLFLKSKKKQQTKQETKHQSSAIRELARPERILSSELETEVRIPIIKQIHFEINPVKVFLRIFKWYHGFGLYGMGVMIDKLRKRDTTERRAVRLRETFERLGGTFLKIGQQMSMRVDLIPFEYCNELAKMLDTIKPFSFEEAQKIIERVTGKPLHETFRAIDARPIGSASVACVFKAELQNGDVVAVKLRRPNIGEQFITDVTAMKWVVSLSEFLTLARPGTSINIVKDLKSILLEELDFRREARYMDVFRRQCKKHRQKFVKIPRCYQDLSDEEMLVSEFVEGISMVQILAAVERKDEQALAVLRERNIVPKTLALRISRIWNFSLNIIGLFHGDPHPANILVQSNSKIVLLDFGSCGFFSQKDRDLYANMAYYQYTNDIEGTVETVIQQMAPIPLVNMDEFSRVLKNKLWYPLLAYKTKKYEWFERTTMPSFLAMMEMNREYNFLANVEMLRLSRAGMLIDTVVGRLSPINIYKEIRNYHTKVAKIRKRRMRKTIGKESKKKRIRDLQLQSLEEDMAFKRMAKYRLEKLLKKEPVPFVSLVEKGAYVGSLSFRFLKTAAFTAFAATAAYFGYEMYIQGNTPTIAEAFLFVLTSKTYLGLVFFSFLLNVRRALFRLDDIKNES